MAIMILCHTKTEKMVVVILYLNFLPDVVLTCLTKKNMTCTNYNQRVH